jgi:hypothetical protein
MIATTIVCGQSIRLQICQVRGGVTGGNNPSDREKKKLKKAKKLVLGRKI